MNVNSRFMLKLRAAALIVFFWPHFSVAQNTDSFQKALLAHLHNDTTRVSLLLKLAGAYEDINADSATAVATRALQTSEQLSYGKGKARSLELLGLASLRKNDYEKSLKYYQDAAGESAKINDGYIQSSAWMSMADIYYRQANYTTAVEYYYKGIEVSRKIGDYKHIGLGNISIGGLFSDLGNYTEALKHYLEGLKAFEKIDDLSGKAMTLTNIATVYSAMGDHKKAVEYIKQSLSVNDTNASKEATLFKMVNTGIVYGQMKDANSALYYFNRAVQLADSIGDNAWKATCLTNVAEMYSDKNSYDTALAMYNKVVKLSQQNPDPNVLVIVYKGIGRILIKQGRVEDGIKELQKTYDLAQKNQMKQIIFETARDLSEAYEKLHDYTKALAYHKTAYNYKDTVYNEKNDRRLQQMQFDYELEKKQSQIGLLNKDKQIAHDRSAKQRMIIWTSAIALILTLTICLLLYRGQSREQKRRLQIMLQKEELQRQALQLEEMNRFKDKTFSVLSHDLRGPIASFSTTMTLLDENYMTLEEFAGFKPEIQRQLASLNLLLDNLLNWSKNYIQGAMTMPPERINIFNVAEANIQLFEDAAADKRITIHNDIPRSFCVMGYLGQIDIIIRNVIVNAIKFSYAEGQIALAAVNAGNRIKITVTDNGKGMTPEQINKLFMPAQDNFTVGTAGEKGIGLGLLLCDEFVRANKGSISVSSKPGEGSTFTIELPAAVSADVLVA